MALTGNLPPSLPPAKARAALGAALFKAHEAPTTFDTGGWLRVGLNGAQPRMAERYISTGSLYLTCTGFLPLGLFADDPFWSDPPIAWTQKALWTEGLDIGPDRALKE